MPVGQAPFEIKVESKGDAVVCRLIGSASMEACDMLSEQLLSAAGGHGRLVIDLGELEFICSMGLGAIVASYLRMSKKQGQFRLVQPLPQIVELLEVTKLGTLLEVYDSVEEALTS